MPKVFSCGTAWLTIEIVLKNHHGCDFVNVLPPLPPVETHFFEVLFGGKTGKTLVPEYNPNVQLFLNFAGEAGYFLALAALLSVHMQRLADNDFVHLIFVNKAAQKIDIGFKVFSLNRRPGLCCQQERVTYGNTDGFVSDIERHNPHIFMIQPPVRRAIIKLRAIGHRTAPTTETLGRPQF